MMLVVAGLEPHRTPEQVSTRLGTSLYLSNETCFSIYDINIYIYSFFFFSCYPLADWEKQSSPPFRVLCLRTCCLSI